MVRVVRVLGLVRGMVVRRVECVVDGRMLVCAVEGVGQVCSTCFFISGDADLRELDSCPTGRSFDVMVSG